MNQGPPTSSEDHSNEMSWIAEEDHDEQQEDSLLKPESFRAPDSWYRLFRPFRVRKQRAINEWLAYYNGLYSIRLPDPRLFGKLLARNGCWDMPSPYVPGSALSTRYFSGGIFLADINFLLDRWLYHVLDGGLDFFKTPAQNELSGDDRHNPYVNSHAPLPGQMSTSYPLSPESYSPIHFQQAMEKRAQDLHDLHAAIAGSQCLALLFLDKPIYWTWIIDRLHADNRAMISTIVYEAATEHQRPLLVSAWVKNGWISAASSERLVAALSHRPTPQPPISNHATHNTSGVENGKR